MVKDLYVKLYTTEPCEQCDKSQWNFPLLSHDDIRQLNHLVTDHKIKNVVF